MLPPRQNFFDIIVIIESSAFVGVCFDQLKSNFLQPLLQFFYGSSITEEIGVTHDINKTIFCGIGYKGFESYPLPICNFMQPTSHPKLFYDKMETYFDFQYGLDEENSHLAEAFALALDTFEEISKRRKQIGIHAKHIVLIASKTPYYDIPIFESNTYRGYKLDDMIQNLQNMNVSLSVISPKFSMEFVKLYEQVNRRNAEFKVEITNNNSYLLLLHNSINLNFERQQTHQQQQIQQIQPVQMKTEIAVLKIEPKQEPQQFDEVFQKHIEGSTNVIAPPNVTIQPPTKTEPSQNQPIQQYQMQQSQQVFDSGDIYNQQHQPPNVTITQSSAHSQLPNVISSVQQLRFTSNKPIINPQHQVNINQVRQMSVQQSPQIQATIKPLQQQPQIIPQNTVAYQVQTAPMNQQQQQQQQINPQPLNQHQQMNQQQNINTQQIINSQQTMNLQQNMNQYQAPIQSKAFWSGIIEWYEKTANNKILHQTKVTAYSSTSISSVTGQPEADITPLIAQSWPPKLQLQLIGTPLMTMLGAQFEQNSKRIVFIPDGNNQDLKNGLNATGLAGGFINFTNTKNNSDIKILFLQNVGNEIVGKIPIDQTKFILNLRAVIGKRQQEQQMKMQYQQSQQQQQQHPQQDITMINNPGQMQQIQQQHQMNDQSTKDLRHLLSTQPQTSWINVNQQQQMQQPNQQQAQLMVNNQQMQQQGNMYITQSNNPQNMQFNNMDMFQP